MEPSKRGSFVKCAMWLSKYYADQEQSDEVYFTDFGCDESHRAKSLS